MAHGTQGVAAPRRIGPRTKHPAVPATTKEGPRLRPQRLEFSAAG